MPCRITQRYNTQHMGLLSNTPVDSRCNTALHLASDFAVMRSFLEKLADVEAENVDGLRPIHCAVRTGLVELVELLIQHGANLDAADMFGNRPLHDAVCHGLKVVQLLVQHGAKLNVQNIDGKTPLHIAIERQQCDVIMFLMSQDADAGLTDIWRNTPLHYVTSELLTVDGIAEHIAPILINKHQHTMIQNAVGMCTLMHISAHGISDFQFYQERPEAKTAVAMSGNTQVMKKTADEVLIQISSILSSAVIKSQIISIRGFTRKHPATLCCRRVRKTQNVPSQY